MRPLRLAISLGMFSVAFFLMAGSKFGITGAFVGESVSNASSLFGVITALVAGMVFATGLENKFMVRSSIKHHPGLVRLAEESMKNMRVKAEADHLTYELSRGNLQAGLGSPGHIKGTDVYYLRGRNGARVYYTHKNRHTFEIVAKSDKGNEDRAFDLIRRLRQD